VDKITFLRHSFDAALGQFLPVTNQFTDNYVTNGVVGQQRLERVVSKPDFLFTAADVVTGSPTISLFERTGTSNWVNNAALNGIPTAAGPGNIQPSVILAFNKLGITWATAQ